MIKTVPHLDEDIQTRADEEDTQAGTEAAIDRGEEAQGAGLGLPRLDVLLARLLRARLRRAAGDAPPKEEAALLRRVRLRRRIGVLCGGVPRALAGAELLLGADVLRGRGRRGLERGGHGAERAGGERGGGGRERRARAPDELDELVLEVAARRDDGVEVVGPDEQHALVAL